MRKNLFLPGLILGALAGTLIGIKLKTEERQVKRSVNKAKRNVGQIFDHIGM